MKIFQPWHNQPANRSVPLCGLSILSKQSIVFFFSCAFVGASPLPLSSYNLAFKCGGFGLRGRLLWNGGDQERAVELINGKRRQGVLIILFPVVITSVVAMASSFAMDYAKHYSATKLVTGFLHVLLGVVLNLFILLVNRVFFYECKRRHGG